MKKKITLLIVFIIPLLIFVIPTQAQSSIGRIVITEILTNTESFPQITVSAFVMQSDGTSAPNISKDMIQLTENGENVAFEMEQIDSGSHTVIVLDMGKWIGNRLTRDNATRVRKIMLEIALHQIDAMKENDFIEVIVVYDKTPNVVQTFTNDKDRLRNVVKQLNWDNEAHSHGLEAAGYAISSLSKQANAFSKRILFLSPGIMAVDPFGEYKESIAQAISKHDILFYSVNINWNWDYKLYGENIEYISKETGGVFIPYLSPEDLDILYTSLEENQVSYQFIYRSPSGSSLQRTVKLNYLGGGEISDSKMYSIDPSLIAPANVIVNVNNGENISVNPEKEAVSVPIHVALEGMGNRKITRISFWVNGQEMGGLETIDATTYSTTWSISPKQLGLPYGDTEVSLVIKVEDELSIIHEGYATTKVSVEAPTGPLCDALSKLRVGDDVVQACIKSGITLMTLFLGIIALILAVLLWLKRDTVAKAGREVKVRMTNVVDRLTNRLRKLEPKARLVAIKGIPEGNRMKFDLFGETSIGVDGEFATLILDNSNISGLHCTLHEDHEGIWTIEDQESTNGTFVNGKRITAFNLEVIEEGFLIELAPVEYGGIKFRFEIIDSFNDDGAPNIYDDYDDNDNKEASQNIRVTQRNTQPRDTSDTDLSESEESLDFSDPANQRY